MRLCGPFDVLHAAANGKKEFLYSKPVFMHARFPNDPPEVLTAIVDVGSASEQHWGYFRCVRIMLKDSDRTLLTPDYPATRRTKCHDTPCAVPTAPRLSLRSQGPAY